MSDSEMKSMLDKLLKTVEELKSSQNDTRAEVRESCGISKNIKAEMENFSHKVSSLESSLVRIIHKERSNNIIIFGAKFEEGRLDLQSFIMALFRKVDLDIPEIAVADVFKLGKNKNNCPIVVKFIAPRWVKHVFTKVTELKGLNIVIANDRSRQEREARRDLRAQKVRLKEVGYQTKIIRNRIYIGEKEIALEELDSLLAAKKKRKFEEESDEPQDTVTGISKNKKRCLTNRDLLMLDKNNQSIKNFLLKDADSRPGENSQQGDQKKPA